MSKKISSVILIGGLLAVATQPVDAHHSSSPHFDSTKPIQLDGVVTEFKLVNPHAWVYLDVKAKDGTLTNWNCEMSSAASLIRKGWTPHTFTPGMVVKLDGIAARRDPVGCSFSGATLVKDGTVLGRDGTITKSGAAAAEPEVATSAVNVPVPAAGTNPLNAMAGMWITTSRRPGGGNSPNGGPPQADRVAPFISDAGKVALAKYDDRFDDPALKCSPSSIIRGWGEPNSASEISIKGKTLTIKHEYMDTVRTVDLSTRKHPAKITPSLTGHSVGWLEGKTLVIETIGFKPGVLLPHPGMLNSADMKVVERLTLSDDGKQLVRKYEVTDPQYLKTTYTGESSWDRSNISVGKYDCTELGGVSNIRK